jgi:hypothetical protein
MVFRSDASLDELLADPIVVLLMGRDGVSQEDARRLYENVGRRLRQRAAAPCDGRLRRDEPNGDPWDCHPRDPCLPECLTRPAGP